VRYRLCTTFEERLGGHGDGEDDDPGSDDLAPRHFGIGLLKSIRDISIMSSSGCDIEERGMDELAKVGAFRS